MRHGSRERACFNDHAARTVRICPARATACCDRLAEAGESLPRYVLVPSMLPLMYRLASKRTTFRRRFEFEEILEARHAAQ